MVELYLRSLNLKDEPRSGWILRGVDGPESVADHSWGTALLCMLYADAAGASASGDRVDRPRAVQMAVVHDLAEAITGDVATRVARMADPAILTAKRQRESGAMDELLHGDETAGDSTARVRELWEEYEESTTATARFVRDMNLIDMCAQALEYERLRRYDPAAENRNFPDFAGMDEFFATTRPRLSTAIGRELLAELSTIYGTLDSVEARGGLNTELADPGDAEGAVDG